MFNLGFPQIITFYITLVYNLYADLLLVASHLASSAYWILFSVVLVADDLDGL